MAELTLEQWKERALVAEALLEERTQECEKLRAEADLMKENGGALKPGDRFTIQGMEGDWIVQDVMGGIPEADPGLREYLEGDRWTEEQLRRFKEQMKGLLDDAGKEERFRRMYGGMDFGREIRRGRMEFRSPMDEYKCVVTEDQFNGSHKIGITKEGSPDLAINFKRGFLRSRPPLDIARTVAREVATKWYLDTREEETVATLVRDTIEGFLRGGKGRRVEPF